MNGTVSSFDASNIKHVVGLDTLNYLQNFLAMSAKIMNYLH